MGFSTNTIKPKEAPKPEVKKEAPKQETVSKAAPEKKAPKNKGDPWRRAR